MLKYHLIEISIFFFYRISNIRPFFSGLRVKWDGYVSNIKITRVQNTWADILKRLPDTIGSAIACAVTSLSEDRSQDDTHCQDFSHTLAEHQNCLRIKQLSAHSQICSLTHWNRYVTNSNV